MNAEEKIARRFESRESAPLGNVVEVVQLWGDAIVGIGHFGARGVRVGNDRECAFAAAIDPFDLVVREGRAVIVRIPSSASGAQIEHARGNTLDDALTPESEEVVRLALGEGTTARIAIGAITFLVRRVDRVPPVKTNLRTALDAGFLSVLGVVTLLFLGGSLGVWVLGMLGLLTSAPGPLDLARGIDSTSANVATTPEIRMASLHLPAPEHGGNPDAGPGAKAAGREGTRGLETAKNRHAQGGRDKSPNSPPNEKMGVRDGFAIDRNELLALVAGPDRVGGGNGAQGHIAGLTVGDATGSHGAGIRGGGPGGGGHSLDAGGWSDHGHAGGDHGYGHEGGHFDKQRGDASIEVGGSDTIMGNAIDPALIDAVIKRQIASIQYCYEKELPAHPGLHGKILVGFLIGSDGHVTTASVASSTIDNHDVEDCVTDRFRHLGFPRPTGGGTVAVRYPLLFKAAGL